MYRSSYRSMHGATLYIVLSTAAGRSPEVCTAPYPVRATMPPARPARLTAYYAAPPVMLGATGRRPPPTFPATSRRRRVARPPRKKKKKSLTNWRRRRVHGRTGARACWRGASRSEPRRTFAPLQLTPRKRGVTKAPPRARRRSRMPCLPMGFQKRPAWPPAASHRRAAARSRTLSQKESQQKKASGKD